MDKKQCRLCRQALPATAFKVKKDAMRTLTCRKCLAEQRCYLQEYRQTHTVQIAKSKRKYREKHKEQEAEYQRQYYQKQQARKRGANAASLSRQSQPLIMNAVIPPGKDGPPTVRRRKASLVGGNHADV